ncbi:hypothetical protein [Methanoculleus sp.]|uniref:hypothetical protein n=1 Tax=Methanoculleus sp. TaxID=90427 RepID=UPI001BD65B7A|nr:hypothetical protein [Methanoculleus sp.]
MEEPEAGAEEGEDGGGPVAVGREGCRRPVLEEPDGSSLVFQVSPEVFPHRP